MAEQIKFISFDVWSKNQSWIHEYIDAKDAKSLKSVALAKDGHTLNFYTVETPVEGTLPTFTIELPETDLSNVMEKISGAVQDNIVIANADGTVKDSGIGLNKVAIKDDVTKEIMEKISQSEHMKKQVVDQLPTPEEADINTFYLLKKADAVGKDTYEIYTKIGAELILIDDTSVDLSGYVTDVQLTQKLETLKTEVLNTASTDAQTKATKALEDAKQYSDSKTGPLETRVTKTEEDIVKNTNDISTANQTLTSYGDRITALESGVNNMQVATEQECKEQFDKIFYPGTSV